MKRTEKQKNMGRTVYFSPNLAALSTRMPKSLLETIKENLPLITVYFEIHEKLSFPVKVVYETNTNHPGCILTLLLRRCRWG